LWVAFANTHGDPNRNGGCIGNAYGNRNGNGDCIGNAYGNRNGYCYRSAEVYADAQAASHTSASTVRSALARVFPGTRDHSRVPAFCIAKVLSCFTDIVFEEADPP
jgi:hypothetical protein